MNLLKSNAVALGFHVEPMNILYFRPETKSGKMRAFVTIIEGNKCSRSLQLCVLFLRYIYCT
jgi:hypothetical protein